MKTTHILITIACIQSATAMDNPYLDVPTQFFINSIKNNSNDSITLKVNHNHGTQARAYEIEPHKTLNVEIEIPYDMKSKADARSRRSLYNHPAGNNNRISNTLFSVNNASKQQFHLLIHRSDKLLSPSKQQRPKEIAVEVFLFETTNGVNLSKTYDASYEATHKIDHGKHDSYFISITFNKTQDTNLVKPNLTVEVQQK